MWQLQMKKSDGCSMQHGTGPHVTLLRVYSTHFLRLD